MSNPTYNTTIPLYFLPLRLEGFFNLKNVGLRHYIINYSYYSKLFSCLTQPTNKNKLNQIKIMDEYVDMPEGRKKVVDGFNFLGLGNFTSLITNIKFADWGHTVLIDCVYHP